MIRYLDNSIIKYTNVNTGEDVYMLCHYSVSDDEPEIVRVKESGYFKSYEEAEDHHNELLVKGLIEN